MVAGPLAGSVLADLGAEVIKVETPDGGDRMRYMGHRVDDIGAFWANVNRGKRSLVLDLRQAEALQVFRDLIARTDVFIQNFRPGVVDRLGIDEASLRAVRPDLVYVSVSGFGETGPYIDQKSYDYVIQALSGMASLQRDSGGEPALIRNVVIDKVTAMAAVQSVLAAVVARLRGQGGQHIRISMIDVALAFFWPDGMMQHTLLDTERVTPGPHMADNYLVRRTVDGHLALMATSNSQFPGLCAALGTETWLTDPRFVTLEAREANAAVLNELITAEVAKHTAADLVARLHAHDVPCAAVNPLERVHLDPQVQHNDTLVVHERPWLGTVREPRPPARYSATPTSLGRHAPRLDEHTDEVLAELGRSREQIADLRTRGVVGARR
jgi:crotonobetainyl-CoA:carnitine CoA-transferase CaiB-like acyl-CoA transferase